MNKLPPFVIVRLLFTHYFWTNISIYHMVWNKHSLWSSAGHPNFQASNSRWWSYSICVWWPRAAIMLGKRGSSLQGTVCTSLPKALVSAPLTQKYSIQHYIFQKFHRHLSPHFLWILLHFWPCSGTKPAHTPSSLIATFLLKYFRACFQVEFCVSWT